MPQCQKWFYGLSGEKKAKATYQAICVRAAPSVVVDIWYLDVNVQFIYRLLPPDPTTTHPNGQQAHHNLNLVPMDEPFS